MELSSSSSRNQKFFSGLFICIILLVYSKYPLDSDASDEKAYAFQSLETIYRNISYILLQYSPRSILLYV